MERKAVQSVLKIIYKPSGVCVCGNLIIRVTAQFKM